MGIKDYIKGMKFNNSSHKRIYTVERVDDIYKRVYFTYIATDKGENLIIYEDVWSFNIIEKWIERKTWEKLEESQMYNIWV